MLLRQGEKIDYKDKKDDLVLEILAYKSALEKIGFPITFRFPDKLFTTTGEGKIESPGAKRLATSIIHNGPNGSEEISYCEKYHFDDAQNIVRTPYKIVIDKTLVIQKKDWDLAVYLRYFYPHYGYNYELVDDKKINENKFEEDRQETKVRTYIHTPELYDFTIERLERVASACGITEKNTQTLKNRLWDYIKNEQDLHGRGYQEFMKLIEEEKFLSIKINVQRAIDNEIIKNFSEDSSWSFVVNGGKGSVICRYNVPDNAVGELVEHYSKATNKKQLTRLINLLGSKAEKI